MKHFKLPSPWERGGGEASVLFLLLALASCNNDAYETGDSRYSYLRTDFVEARADAHSQILTAVTDDGVELTFTKAASVSWVTVPDSTYRALCYYNIQQAAADSSRLTVEPVALGTVYVLRPVAYSDTMTVATDPVHFQSLWTSRNGSYLNLSLALMTGVADSIDARQTIGMVCDTVMRRPDGHSTYCYRLEHSQGGVPQYYKSTVYVSIPIKTMTAGDRVRLSLNTYNGPISREVGL